MDKFLNLKSIPSYLPLQNIDTDMIIPKQFLKTIKRTGLGKSLFYEMRYDENGNLIKDFTLNNEPYNKSKILLAGKNFGCGSSREHAPWALSEYGFKVIISTSFADIFRNNCMQNGLITIVLSQEKVDKIMTNAIRVPDYKLTVNLETQNVSDNNDFSSDFDFDQFRKDSILKGLDDIGITLQFEKEISNFESKI